MVSFGGVLCIGCSEDSNENGSIVGDFFALLGAGLYAVYSLCLKNKEKNDTVLMFGCVGVINCLALFPGIFLLDFFGIEEFQVPNDKETTLIIANALIGGMLCDLL